MLEELKDKSKVSVTTTLFSKNKNYTKKVTVKM